MATLSDLYALVREQTQTNDGELPDSTINPYLKEGFDRTIAAYTNWPFYEQTWQLTQPAGDFVMALPGDAHQPGIISLVAPSGHRLQLVNPETAESVYESAFGTSDPAEYSIWGSQITLWPKVTFSEERIYTMRGFRRSAPWTSMKPESQLDCDERLHIPIAHYATSLAYAQQEDDVLETTYMTRWQRDVEIIARAIMEPARDRPVTMGPRYRRSQPGRPFVIHTPPVGAP